MGHEINYCATRLQSAKCHLQLPNSRLVPSPGTVYGVFRQGTLHWRIFIVVVVALVKQIDAPEEKQLGKI